MESFENLTLEERLQNGSRGLGAKDMRIFLKERDQIADLNMRNSSSDRSHHASSLQISSSQNSANTISAKSNSSDNSQRNFKRLSQIFGDYYEDQML